MNFLVGVVHDFTQSFYYLRQEARDLLGCAVRHVSKSFYCRDFGTPVIGFQLRQELGQGLLDGIVREVCHYSLQSTEGCFSNHLLLVTDGAKDVREDVVEVKLKTAAHAE